MSKKLEYYKKFFEHNWNYSVSKFSSLGEGKGTSSKNYKVTTAGNGTWVLRFPQPLENDSFNEFDEIYALAQVAVIQELHESQKFHYHVPFVQPTNSGSHVISVRDDSNKITEILYLNKLLEGETIPEETGMTEELASSIGEMMSAFHNSLSGICNSTKKMILNGEIFSYSEILKPETTLSNILEENNAQKSLYLIENKRGNYNDTIHESFQKLVQHLNNFHSSNLRTEYQTKINIPANWIANHNDWQPNNLMWDHKTHKITGIIDFGTLAIGPRIIDIANAVKFIWGIFGKTNNSLIKAFYQGYNHQTKISEITELENQLLPYIMLDNISQKLWYSFDRVNRELPKKNDKIIIKRESSLIDSVISLIK